MLDVDVCLKLIRIRKKTTKENFSNLNLTKKTTTYQVSMHTFQSWFRIW